LLSCAGTLAVLALLFVAPSAKLNAQSLSGIVGTVSDATGAVVPNAKVTVTNIATNVVKVTDSSSAGSYQITDLIPGTYKVQVEIAGFQASIHDGVLVEVGRNSTVDVTLQTGNVTQSVEVQESALTLNTTQPELGTTIENKVVQELPLEISGGRGRQIDSFVFLAPGVTGGTFSKRINGGTDFQNEVVFNGIPMAQSETQGFQTIWNPPFEQVSEFNVLRSSFSAQYGLAQGVVTYHTASGTNQFHGDGFEILRNNFFDARGAYNTETPIDKENNFGFSIGGPVIIPKLYNGKNRTFFFTTFEWYRLNQTDTTKTSLPTAAEKQGNFTGVNTIYDPLTGQPFPNDTIPQSRFSPLSQTLLPSLPDPSLPGLVNNFSSPLGVLPQRQNPWGVNIDHNINDKQSIHWAEWRDKQTSFGREGNGTFQLGNPLSSFSSTPDLGTVFILNYANALTPHLVMTAGASWLGELNDQISLTKNVNFAAAPGAQQLPGVNFAGPNSPTGFGAAWIESINRKLGWVAENNFLWIKGRHTFNIGWEMRRTYQDDNECQRCAGNFNFSNNQTANPADLANTGNAFASFLLGTVDSANRYGTYELRLRNFDFSPYIQDDIKLRPNLTINVGLRWDVMVPFTEVNNLVVFFDSKTPNPEAGGLPGAAQQFGNCAGCAGFDRASIHWKHLSPRVGFSYGVSNKTVIQGGFSWNYLDGGAYEYGTAKVAVNYANLLDGSFQRNSTGTTTPAFGSWDSNTLPYPSPIPFSPSLGVAGQINGFNKNAGLAPYDMVWSINLQHELPYNMLVNATYTGNRGNFLPGQLNPINQIDPKYLSLGATLGLPVNSPQAIAAGIKIPYPNFLSDFGGSATVLQALRPYPQYAGIFNNFDDASSSLYNAAQIQLEKRYTNGLSFLVSYTLSHMLSNTSSGFTSFSSSSLNKNNQKAEWAVDGSDQPQVLAIAGTYELPIGPGKAFLNRHDIAGKLLGGWQVSPLLTYAKGTPLSVGTAGDPLGNGFNRPNVVPGVTQQFSYSNVYSGASVINPAAFANPGLWVPGNEPRELSGLRNPTGLNENVALSKSFPIGEHVKAKLEMEYFNVFNRVIFGGPDTTLQDANFGKVINSQANTQRQGQAHFTLIF
jgi:muramidase (phage lysozyme)